MNDAEPAWLSRVLRPIARVERGEAVTALLLTLNVFLLLSAYYVILLGGALALSVRAIAGLNVVLGLIWLLLAWAIGDEHARQLANGSPRPGRPGKWRARLLGGGAGLCVMLLAPTGQAARKPPLEHARESRRERALPDYGGRPYATPSPGLLWVPRVLLFPAYALTEYGLRRALGAAISAAERNNLPSVLFDFFTFGPEHRAGIIPVGFVDFGFRPSVGVYGFWDGAGLEQHSLRLRATSGGSDWLSLAVADRFRLTHRIELSLAANYTRRPDDAFYGVGPDTREQDLTRFGEKAENARLILRVRSGPSSLETSVGYRVISFYPGGFGASPTLSDAARDGRITLPDGYLDGYAAPLIATTLVLDSRPDQARSQSGARLELVGEEGSDLSRAEGAGWIRYGGTLGAFWDVAGSGRVLSLSASVELADPLGSRVVPFTELSTLGGPGEMPGFREGRLRGRSSAVTTLRYTWPIWMWLGGSLQGAVGNVFDAHLSSASLGRCRFSGAIGVESLGSRDSVLQILLGFGTETFDSGAHIDAPRLVIGARRGF